MPSLVDPLTRSGIEVGGRGIPHSSEVHDREFIGNFNSITGWTVLNDDTSGLATDLSHILGTASLEFDKVDGAGNKTTCGIQCTLSTAVDCSRFIGSDHIETAVYVSDLTNVAYALIRLGTDASNYNEWRIDDSAMTAAVWDVLDANLNTCQVAVEGNGWNPSAITYIFVGIEFDGAANTLADIRFDHVLIRTAVS